jgi:hypothetical protein
MDKPGLMYYNDARHYLMYRYDPPMSLHQLRQPVDELLGTGVDTLVFGLASGHTFLHDTKVGLRWGEGMTEHGHGIMWWRAAKNLERALADGLDPLKIVIDRAHEKGLKVICSLRINEGSMPDDGPYMAGKLKYGRPDLLIGDEAADMPGIASAYDFAKEEVRAERLAVIEEVVDRYGADGIEIDEYIRAYFKPSEVEKNTPVLTQFMGDVRKLLDRIGAKRGEKLLVTARVHHNEQVNLAAGADVRAWLGEGFVDMVIPTGGGLERWLFDTNPYGEWMIEATHAAGAWAYSPLGRIPYDDRYHEPTVDMYRAAAGTYRATGFDGLYMEGLPWPHTENEYLILRELGDADIYARKAKHYILAPQVGDDEHALVRHLPVNLEEGKTVTAPIFVGDALDSARADSELEQLTLLVRIVQTGMEDKISFSLNGRDLSIDAAKVRTFYGGTVSYSAARTGLPDRINTHYWFEWDLALDLVREGENRLDVRLDYRLKERVEDRVLQSIELRIGYKAPPLTTGGQM